MINDCIKTALRELKLVRSQSKLVIYISKPIIMQHFCKTAKGQKNWYFKYYADEEVI